MKVTFARTRYTLLRFLRMHQTFVVLVVVLLVSLGVLIRVYSLGNLPPDQAYIDRESANIKAVSFNDEAIEYITSLRDSNVQAPGTQISEGRQNPFSE